LVAVEVLASLVEAGEEVVVIQHSPIPQDPLLQKEEVVVDQDQDLVA
tara:strand:+ start:41 stop:181 length:141 start_codon:yes stop_codon:yes gene_type:complete